MLGFTIIMFCHWLFDFACQNDKMAINKSTSFKWLGIHCLVYSLWGFFLFPYLGTALTLFFVGYLFVTHFMIDGVTSRLTSYLWKKGDRHNFFVVIGFDQFLHYVTIFALLNTLLGE
jgi:uncharacterized membrane protein